MSLKKKNQLLNSWCKEKRHLSKYGLLSVVKQLVHLGWGKMKLIPTNICQLFVIDLAALIARS